MPVAKDASIVKIAVKPFINDPQYVPQLIEFDQRSPLSSVVSELCLNWNITDCENYALKFTDSSSEGVCTIIDKAFEILNSY
jgi:engulfment and cell motility protein 1